MPGPRPGKRARRGPPGRLRRQCGRGVSSRRARRTACLALRSGRVTAVVGMAVNALINVSRCLLPLLLLQLRAVDRGSLSWARSTGIKSSRRTGRGPLP